MVNVAYIDGQNLYLWTKADWRFVDFKRLRIFLKDKFNVEEAYYFIGFVSEEEQALYNNLQKAGFIVVFREHSATLKGKKKGNVDVDIVFEIMKKIYEEKDFDKIVLVTGDGDYIKLVKHLIKKNLLHKVVFPNKNYSSLYNSIGNSFYYCLLEAKRKIEHNKKRGS